ncbi:hypothetical protein Efla_002123 [Eimeria flavescens]
MEGLEGVEQALPAEALAASSNITSMNETSLPLVSQTQGNQPAENKSRALSLLCSRLRAKLSGLDRRVYYLLGMLISALHPITALYMVTYKECPLDDLGHPIPDYEPPPPCEVGPGGAKTNPQCVDPPQAYARVENICFMYLANEFVLHVTYVLYVKVWTLGGRSVGAWRELIGYGSYFVVEFILNAAPYHVQTFPDFRDAVPFLHHFNWPLYAAFIFGSILLIPLGIFLARTRDQTRRALLFLLPGIVFFGVDIFNRTVFLPFFETMQHKFAQLELHEAISFIGELALANFYGSIFLPATHKAAIIFAEFGYNVSYLKVNELTPEENTAAELVQKDNEEAVHVLLELDPPSATDVWQQNVKDDLSSHPRGENDFAGEQGETQRANTGNRSTLGGADLLTQDTDSDHPTANSSQHRVTHTFDNPERSSRFGSRASNFSAGTRTSRLLAPIVAHVENIRPSGPHVPLRPDGPDPLEFDKILCWLSILWDAWRYLLIRTVLLKASSIFLYLLMVLKDFSFSYWHFGFAFTERRILTVLEGDHEERKSAGERFGHFLFRFFQIVIVRPFLLTKFLSTTVWRTEFIFGMNERRQNYSQSVYFDPNEEPEVPRTSFRGTIRRAGGRKPTASDWASALSTIAVEKGRRTKGVIGSLCSDLWTHLVLNVRRDWRHWSNKDFERYKHPVQHWKKRMAASKEGKPQSEEADGMKADGLEVRYCFANECVIIHRVPPKPKIPKSRSSSRSLSRTHDVSRPTGESVFRRINAAWLSKVIKEIQSLIFNRCWPRLLQKLMASSVLLATELYTEHSIVSLLPSYQQFGLFRDAVGRFRVLFMFSIDVVEVSAVWYTQTLSRFYESIRKGYNLFHDLTMICLCVFNCAAQIMNFAMLRYIRFAPICGDKRVLPDDVQQDMLLNLNLVKYWEHPDA